MPKPVPPAAVLPDRLRAFRRVDLNLFVVFATIHAQGSLTAAGQALGLTQPAVSHALARLRRALGDELFVREGSSLAATPFARGIIDDVHLALDTLRAGPLGERRFDPATSTAGFSIAMPMSMELFLLPPLLQRLAAEAPGVSLTTTRALRSRIEPELARGSLSMAIDAAGPIHADLRGRLLVRDDLVTVARKGHPLLHRGLSPRTYLEARHILVTARGSDGDIEDYELLRLGHRRHIVARCVNLVAALQAVARTDCLLTLGRRQLGGVPGDHGLTVFEFPFPGPHLDALLFWHERADQDPANRWLRQIVFDLFRAVPMPAR